MLKTQKNKNIEKVLAFRKGIRYNIKCSGYGRLAQLVEHSLDVRRVSGSSPLMSTKESRLLKQTGFLLIYLLRFNIFTLTLKSNEKQSVDRLGRSSVFPLTKAKQQTV